MTENLKLGVSLSLIALVLLIMVPLQLIALLFYKFGKPELAGRLPVIFHKLVLIICGVRHQTEGKLSPDRPLLLVSNHVSWLDIVVLGAVAPLSFAAKLEMKNWPVFGTLARLQRTVFVDRERRSSAAKQADDIASRMTAKEIMVLFPEGTTTDGNKLAPFKTPLFEAAKLSLKESQEQTAVVQPIAIRYTHLHGLPIGRAERPHIAWPGEVGLWESLSKLLRERALDVTVSIGKPIALSQESNRKIIAKETSTSIRSMLDSSRSEG